MASNLSMTMNITYISHGFVAFLFIFPHFFKIYFAKKNSVSSIFIDSKSYLFLAQQNLIKMHHKIFQYEWLNKSICSSRIYYQFNDAAFSKDAVNTVLIMELTREIHCSYDILFLTLIFFFQRIVLIIFTAFLAMWKQKNKCFQIIHMTP